MGVIRRQGIKNTITGYLGIVIGFVNLILVQPHFLTKEELGLTRILYSFSLIVAMFVPMGISNAIIRYFPNFKDEKNRHHGFFAFSSLFPLLGFLLAGSVLWVFRDFFLNQYRRESPLFLEYFNWVFPLIFFNSFISVLTAWCQANLKSTIPAFLNDVVVRVLTIGLVSVYFLQWLDLDGFIAAFVALYGFQMLVLLGYIFYFDRPGFRIDWAVFREKKISELIRFGLLLWFASVASIGLKYFDSIMIGKYLPLSFVGIYTIAAFIPTVIEAPLNAFEKIAASKISFAWSRNDKQEIYAIYHKSAVYLFLLGGWLFLMINANTAAIFSFLPEGYETGAPVILVISIGTLFNMATGLNAPILFNSERYRWGAFFLIFLAVAIVVLQMLLIPAYGLFGAALATALASIAYNLLLLVSVWRFFRLQPFDRRNLKVLALLILTYGIACLLPHVDNRWLDMTVRCGALSLVYGLGIYFWKVVPEFHRYLPWEKGG
jgi:O-antigen/teichoic acid export membrane protein